MIEKLKSKIKTKIGNGIFHDSRADVNALAEYCEVLQRKINELVDAVNDKSTPKCEKGCEYCNNGKTLYKETTGTKLYINCSNGARALYLDTKSVSAAYIINNCPNCGRKLEKKTETEVKNDGS